MSTLVELTAQIVSSHASSFPLSQAALLEELQRVYTSLKSLGAGITIPMDTSVQTQASKVTIKQAFKKDEVICFVCGKGFTTLKRHLAVAHNIEPSQYRKQYGIPFAQSLSAKSYVETRRLMAIDRGLGNARNVRSAKSANLPDNGAKAPAPAIRVPTPVPAVIIPAPVPAVKVKAPVPAKVQKSQAPAKSKKSAAGE